MSTAAEYHRDPNLGKSIGSAGVRQQLQQFRQLFANLGFQEQPVAGYLKFTGQLNERNVTLTAGTRQKTKYLTSSISMRVHAGFVMSICMDTRIKTRLLFDRANSPLSWLTKFLQKRRGNTCLTGLDHLYSGFQIWASEPTWAERFLRNVNVQENLHALIHGDRRQHNFIHWAPGRCSFTPAQLPLNLSEKMLTQWLQHQQAVVAAAESQPPQTQARFTWLERQTEKGNLPIILILLLLSVPVLLTLFCIIPALILVFLLVSFV